MNEPEDKTDRESFKNDLYIYPPEIYARELHDRLNEEVAARLEGAVVSLTPKGVNSYCQAHRGRRSCTVYCFHTPRPKFLARFDETPALPLWGRTFVQAEVLGAVRAWLEGTPPPDLCARFPFVERKRRVLGQIEQALLAAEPALAELASHELSYDPLDGGGCDLWFRRDDRACEVGLSDTYSPHCAAFYWDKCFQFRAQLTEETTDPVGTQAGFLQALRSGKLSSCEVYADLGTDKIRILARLMKRWLCDKAMPSAMQREYPWVTMSELAPYYEQGRGVVGEFILSWREVEGFYQRTAARLPVASQVVGLVSQLREAGYERTLRAGNSLYAFLVSRARRHGLKSPLSIEEYEPGKHDPKIVFRFGGLPFNPQVPKGQMQVTACLDDGARTITYPRIELTEELNELLKKLEAMPIG